MNKARNAIAGTAPDMTPDEGRRAEFVAAYFNSGSQVKAAALAGVHIDTAAKWCRMPWFEKALRELKRAKNNGLDGRLTKLLDLTLDQLEERLEQGDMKVVVVGRGDSARTEIEHVPVPARDLAIITGVLFDKRAAIRRDPDATENPEMSALERIADKLREVAAENRAAREAGVVDVEAREVTEPDNTDLI